MSSIDSHIQTTNHRKWQEVLDNTLTERTVGTAAACCCPSPSASGLCPALTGSNQTEFQHYIHIIAKPVSYCLGLLLSSLIGHRQFEFVL